MGKMENKKENRVNKLDLARRIYNKNKDLGLTTIKDFLDIVCNEILEIVIEEKKEVFFNKIVSIKLKEVEKKGYDFKANKYKIDGKKYKLCIKPLGYIKKQVSELNSKIEANK